MQKSTKRPQTPYRNCYFYYKFLCQIVVFVILGTFSNEKSLVWSPFTWSDHCIKFTQKLSLEPRQVPFYRLHHPMGHFLVLKIWTWIFWLVVGRVAIAVRRKLHQTVLLPFSPFFCFFFSSSTFFSTRFLFPFLELKLCAASNG